MKLTAMPDGRHMTGNARMIDLLPLETDHQYSCLFYGFVDSCLTSKQLRAINDAGLDEDEAYCIECDLQCNAFDTFSEALEYYKRRALEG